MSLYLGTLFQSLMKCHCWHVLNMDKHVISAISKQLPILNGLSLQRLVVEPLGDYVSRHIHLQLELVELFDSLVHHIILC
jgi:hypothetical protein